MYGNHHVGVGIVEIRLEDRSLKCSPIRSTRLIMLAGFSPATATASTTLLFYDQGLTAKLRRRLLA